MPRTLPLASALTLLLLAAGPVAAQAVPPEGRLPCHRYDEIARQLGDRYKEAPVSIGVQANGHLLQVFASSESGTWTILSTSPTGLTCVIAAGRSWEMLKGPPDPEA